MRKPPSAASNNAVDNRRRAPGAGSTGLLTPADRVLITVIYLRQICSQNVLSELLGINPNTIGQAIAETRQLLNEHHRTIRMLAEMAGPGHVLREGSLYPGPCPRPDGV